MTTAATVVPASNIVCLRSTLAHPDLVRANKRADLVRLKSGELVPPSVLSFPKKLLHAKSDHYSVSLEPHTLVFRDRLNINGFDVDYKLSINVIISEADRFIGAFLRLQDMSFVTTGLLVKALFHTVHEAVAENLSFVNVARVSGPVKNAARHRNLNNVIQKLGLRCLFDELTLENVA